MSNAIKIYTNLDQGAPILTGQLGKLIDLLQAVLVDGYGSVSVSSITRVGSLVTVVTAVDHGLKSKDSALIAGAVEPEYNGDFPVTTVDSVTFTYVIATTPSTPATGTITSKRASAGFSKPFTGINKAVFRSNDTSATRKYLQVLDDGANTTGGNFEAVVRGYDTMSSVTAGTGEFPTTAQTSTGYIMRKSDTGDSTARPWTLFTDGNMFYLFTQPNQLAPNGVTGQYYTHHLSFGDIVSYKVGDTSNCMIGASLQQNYPYPSSGIGIVLTSFTPPTDINSASCVMAKDVTESSASKIHSIVGSMQNTAPSGTIRLQYPNAADNGLYLVPMQLLQGSPVALRGLLPGLYESLHGPNTHKGGDRISNMAGLPGRTLSWIPCYNTSSSGGYFVDITGPWR